LTSATGIVPPESIAKSVTVTGHYIATYRAPNQIDGQGAVADWEVALLENTPATSILVVRGLWSERLTSPAIAMANEVTVTGILMPHQNDDRAANTDNQLSRLDSALLTSRIDTQLYDGFVIAQNEKLPTGSVERTRISQPVLSNGVPGFYWQHISYVVVWWFMAAMVLWLPFYRGPRKGKLE
jgi:cytochrome oxidase assembly protein ShyY1